MAFDFWEAQRRARSRTFWYVTLFITLTLVVAAGAEFAMRSFAGPDYAPPVPMIGLVFTGITFLVAGYNYMMYRQFGGSYVAESLGGRQVNPQTSNPRARQLMNIVQEMALAASVPVPKVYVLPAEEINAFAAGTTPENAAIAITEGALNTLNREEVQGVIAHEFGHIYNGDMKISMRIAAMVMGFFIVLYLGMRLLQFSGMSGEGRSSRDDEERRGGNPVALAAIILMVAGVVTWFFGSILKAAISRQREYLADACAVQFTRSPRGIANALRKIGLQSVSDMPASGMAFSHLYLNDESGLSNLFATHPPLKKRIEAIEGRTYLPEEWKETLGKPSPI